MFKLHPQLASDTFVLGELPLSRLLLMNDNQFPWCILVPRRAEVSEVFELSAQDQRQLALESVELSRFMYRHFDADKMNVAALGNVVPQLHLHHIARFTTDPAWPKPVWGAVPPVPYSEDELMSRRRAFDAFVTNFR